MQREGATHTMKVDHAKHFLEQLIGDKYIGLRHPNQTDALPDELMHNLHATLAFAVLVHYGNQLKVRNESTGASVWAPEFLALLERLTKDRYIVVQQSAIFYKL